MITALFSTCYGARPISNGQMWDRLAEATKDTPTIHVDVLRAKAKDSAAEKNNYKSLKILRDLLVCCVLRNKNF